MDVTISQLTLACAPWGEPSKHSVLDRAKAAASAGLFSIGVGLEETAELREHRAQFPAEVRIDECEWVDLGITSPYSRAQYEALRFLAGEYGTTRVNSGVCDVVTQEYQAAQNLELLAAGAYQLGMTVAVEPVAFGAMPLVEDVQDLLQLAGYPVNTGLLVDVWQVTWQGQGGYRELPERAGLGPVAEIQVCGTTRMGFLPGSGAGGWQTTREASQERQSLRESRDRGLDIGQWLKEFNTAPISYEVPRSDWRQLPLDDVARLVADDLRILEE
jgi:sugar phosphate isomerase/epimerase